LDFTTERCPLQYGFFTAVYSAPCDSASCKRVASSFGFLEAAEPAEGFTYEDFKAKVLAGNDRAPFRSSEENEYVSSGGHRIRFEPITRDKLDWTIRSIDGKPTATDMSRWPLAFGDIVHADGSGLVEIVNPSMKRKLTLDMRDALAPKTQESDY
jgi:hypothetical protein